jgi:hypothetical protein
MRNTYRILVRKPQRNRPDWDRLFSTDLGVDPIVTDFCDDNIETSVSVKGMDFPNQLNNNHIIKSS